MPIGGRLVGGGRGGQSGGRRVSVCMRAYVSRFGGGAGSILTFAVCASSTVFWEPPLGGWQRHRRETDKIIVVLFSIAFKLKRLGLRRTRLVMIVICYPRLKTGL